MNSNKQNQDNNSELEKFKVFFEHTADSRLIVDKQARIIKHPKHTTAAKR